MRVTGFWPSWLLSLILMITLLGVSRGQGAEAVAPNHASPPPAMPPAAAANPPAPLEPPATPNPRPSAHPKLTLHSFNIVGARQVSVKDLKKQLSEKLPYFWPPWGKPPDFRRQDLEYDLERLKLYYRSQGFYHATIKPELHYGPKGEVDVTLVVHEGPPVKVIDINVKVTQPLGLSQLRSKWPLQPGDRFSEKAYDDLKNLYLNYLPNHGYPRVTEKGRVYLNEKQNTAKIDLTVHPGPLSYFGEVTIKDQEKLETPAAAILEKLTFKPGEVFNLGELFNTQRKLYATNLFRSVVLTPAPVAPQHHIVPIVIQLEERKKRSLKVGLGYGDEEKVRARLGLTYRNLWGGGRLLDLDARYSSLGYLFSETFVNPVVWGSHFDFVNESGARRRDLPGFTDQAYYTQSRLEREIPGNLRVFFGHGLEFDRPFDIPVATLIRLQGTQPEKVYRASYALLGLRRNTVDNPINPHHGGTMNFSNEFAPTFFGSELNFVQSVLDWRHYHALADSDFILAGRVRFGVIQPVQHTQTIPISRLFFAGGATSVRGYALDELGPRNASGDPVGGEAVTVFSLELRYPIPIYKNIAGVVFMDAGNVFPKIHNIDLGQLKYSPGLGVRYLSPVGAIGVDIAFPTNRINYETDKPYQIHFTVGFGF